MDDLIDTLMRIAKRYLTEGPYGRSHPPKRGPSSVTGTSTTRSDDAVVGAGSASIAGSGWAGNVTTITSARTRP